MLARFAHWLRLPMALLACSGTVAAGAMDTATPQVEAAPRVDLKLVEIRLVEPGDAAQNVGPCYRVTVTNAAESAAGGFEISLLAGIDFERIEETAEARVRIERLSGGETRSVDLRLSADAFRLRHDEQASEIPYQLLLVAIDAANEIEDRAVANNRSAFGRDEIRSVGAQRLGGE